MIIIEDIAFIDMPLTVRQLEQVLRRVKDKERVVTVNDETCADAEITGIDIGDEAIRLYINGEVKSMDAKTHLICETAQYITIDAWPELYGEDNKYDIGSARLLTLFREWAEEFEKWWMSLPEGDRDYLLEVEKFTEFKVKLCKELWS